MMLESFWCRRDFLGSASQEKSPPSAEARVAVTRRRHSSNCVPEALSSDHLTGGLVHIITGYHLFYHKLR